MLYPYIEEGGLIWMLPIVFLSFYGVALVLERCYYWVVYLWNSQGREQHLKKIFVMPFRPQEAMQVCEHSKDPVMQTLYEYLKSYESMPLEIAERRANQFAETRMLEARQFIDWLSLVANLSGTLGLAGTVVGISISFKSMAMQDSQSLASSLATALYTTVGGIMLFLPAYLCVFICQKMADHLENALDVNIQNTKDILENQQKTRMIFETPARSQHIMFENTSAKPENSPLRPTSNPIPNSLDSAPSPSVAPPNREPTQPNKD